MDHRIPRQIDILREAAPQMRRLLGRGVAVADGVGVGAPVGVLAVAVLPGVAPLALAARHIVLDEDQIAFLEALALGELAAGLGDVADILVAHDGGLVVRRVLVELDVGAADAADLHLHQRARPPEHPASGIRGSRSCSVRSGRPPALSLPLHISDNDAPSYRENKWG